ncbi:MAG: hypothetical protein WEB55_01865 [Acidimicrobiia bacterium]
MERATGPLLGLVAVLGVSGLAIAIFRVPPDANTDEAAVETTVPPRQSPPSTRLRATRSW